MSVVWLVCPTQGCRGAVATGYESGSLSARVVCGDCFGVKRKVEAPKLAPPPEAETKPVSRRRRG